MPPEAWERDESTRKNRSKTVGMPTPVSESSMQIVETSVFALNRTAPPRGVFASALEPGCPSPSAMRTKRSVLLRVTMVWN